MVLFVGKFIVWAFESLRGFQRPASSRHCDVLGVFFSLNYFSLDSLLLLVLRSLSFASSCGLLRGLGIVRLLEAKAESSAPFESCVWICKWDLQASQDSLNLDALDLFMQDLDTWSLHDSIRYALCPSFGSTKLLFPGVVSWIVSAFWIELLEVKKQKPDWLVVHASMLVLRIAQFDTARFRWLRWLRWLGCCKLCPFSFSQKKEFELDVSW